MNDERLAELKEKYKDRNLLEELAWGIYANHSGYTSKQNGEFLNWLCMMAYKALKNERPQGEWITFPTNHSIIQCSECTALLNNLRVDVFKDKIGKMNFCPNCGADMRRGRKNENL